MPIKKRGEHFVPELITVASPGQTSFTLTYSPPHPTEIKMFVNGVEQEYGTSKDFAISGNTLTWRDRHFTLTTTDFVEVWYFI